MSRLSRSSVLVLSAVALFTTGTTACSYVKPPVLSVTRQGSSTPFFTLSDEDLTKGLNADPTASTTGTTAAQPYVPIAKVVEFLNVKLQGEIWKQLLGDVKATVNEADNALGKERASRQSQGKAPSEDAVSAFSNAEAYGRALAEDEFRSGRRDARSAARNYYDQNRAAFSTPAELCLHVMVFIAGDPSGRTPASDADYATTLAKANAARVRTATEDFEKIAAEVSDIKDQLPTGDLKCRTESALAQQQIPPEALTRLKTLPNGSVDTPVKVQGGYLMFRLDRQNPAVEPAFEAVTAKAQDLAARALGQQLVAQRLPTEVRKFEVKVEPRYGRWDAQLVQIAGPEGAQTPSTPTTAPFLAPDADLGGGPGGAGPDGGGATPVSPETGAAPAPGSTGAAGPATTTSSVAPTTANGAGSPSTTAAGVPTTVAR